MPQIKVTALPTEAGPTPVGSEGLT